MKFGLSEKDFKLVEELALKPLKSVDARVFVFGSRARGKHHPFSDLDILYRLKPDQELPLMFLSRILENLEESNLTIKVDLVNDRELAESYRSSVESDLIEV